MRGLGVIGDFLEVSVRARAPGVSVCVCVRARARARVHACVCVGLSLGVIGGSVRIEQFLMYVCVICACMYV
jgi:hypothetical protein